MDSDDEPPIVKSEKVKSQSPHKDSKTKRKWMKEKHNLKELEKFEKKKKKLVKESNSVEIKDQEVSKKSVGRKYTISIAVPCSILDNAQSPVLQNYLAGQIARAGAIFNVDEIIVFDDTSGQCKKTSEMMVRILQYLECPQYLRKYLFPIHIDLKNAGAIAPLDIPHHLRRTEILPYREGVVGNMPVRDGRSGCYIYVGLDKDVYVENNINEGTRVTIKFDNPDSDYVLSGKGKLKGKIVSPSLPRTEGGIYWGYNVRPAKSFAQVFTECPFENGYDIKIGTSDKGSLIEDLEVPSFNHALVVFGGVEGLEFALENDDELEVKKVSDLFDHYVNSCPSQGSRTIRTEEAVLITMTVLSPLLNKS